MLTKRGAIEIQCTEPGKVPEEVLASNEPRVLRGLAREWPAVAAGRASRQAMTDYILGFYSGQPVTAMLSPPENRGRLFYNDDISGFNFKTLRGKLDEILAELFRHQDQNASAEHQGEDKTPTCYVGSTAVDHWLPQFRQHNDLSMDVSQPLASIWIGNQSRIAAHYDFPSNIACVVAGHRRFTLFPPDQLANLYVGPLDLTPAGQAISLVDFHLPDYQRFPRFADAVAQAQVAELGPGDAIFIPSMWWHHVESLDNFNVLVNYWWRPAPDHMGSPFDALQLALLAFRDLPSEQRESWKHLLNYYVFDADQQDLSHIPEDSRGILSTMTEESAQALRTRLSNNWRAR